MQIFTKDFNLIRIIGTVNMHGNGTETDEFSTLGGVAFDPAGPTLFVTDAGQNARVQIYEGDGTDDKYITIEGAGYCQKDNSGDTFAPWGTGAGLDAGDCKRTCSSDDNCLAVTWDSDKEMCHFQCAKQQDLCDHGCGTKCDEEQRCISAVDSRDDHSMCFVKETSCNIQFASPWVPHGEDEVMIINEQLPFARAQIVCRKKDAVLAHTPASKAGPFLAETMLTTVKARTKKIWVRSDAAGSSCMSMSADGNGNVISTNCKSRLIFMCERPRCRGDFSPTITAPGQHFAAVPLTDGQTLWNDHAYTVTNVPPQMLGATLFQGPHKALPKGTEITVHTDGPSTVYVFFEHGDDTNGRNGGYDASLELKGFTPSPIGTPKWVLKPGTAYSMPMFEFNMTGGDLMLPPTTTGQTVMSIAVRRICAQGCSAAQFDGTAATYVELDHNDARMPSATLEIWIYPRQLNGWRPIRNEIDWPAGGNHWQLKDGRMVFGINGNKPEEQWFTTTFEEETWFHLALTYDSRAKKLKLYVNGQLDEEKDYSGAVQFTAGNVRLGSSSMNAYFDGFMREHRLWRGVRTAEQILTNYELFLTGEEAGLLSVFPMDGHAQDLTGDFSGIFNAMAGPVGAVCPWESAVDRASVQQHVTCPAGTNIGTQCQTGTTILNTSSEDYGDGPAGKACVFPFLWKGVTYDACTEAESPGKPWCGTDAWTTTWKWGFCDMETCTTIVKPGSASKPTVGNVYEKVSGVGGWGGMCSCPDGKVYEVGDNNNGCGSLACYGGTSGTCSDGGISAESAGMSVRCADKNGGVTDEYRKTAGVGGWGGKCTCPSGKTYTVGDNNDSCGSLACIGGTVSKACAEGVDLPAEYQNMQVKCAPPAGATGHVGNNLGFEEDKVAATTPKIPTAWTGMGKVFQVKNQDPAWGGVSSGSGNVYVGLGEQGAYIEQRLYGLDAGDLYKLRFSASHRKGHSTGELLRMMVDKHVVWTRSEFADTFSEYEAEFEASGSSVVVRFQNDADSTDCVVTIDAIEIEHVEEAAALLMNGAFELDLPSEDGSDFKNGYQYRTPRRWDLGDTSGDSSTGTHGTVLVRNGNKPWGGLTSGHGDYFCAIQSRKTGQAIYLNQQLQGLVAGQTYVVDFLAARRPGGGEDQLLKVLVDDTEIWESQHPGAVFSRYQALFVASATTAKLSFENDSPDGDRTVFIDDVHVELPDPELGQNMGFESDEITDARGYQYMKPTSWKSSKTIVVTNGNTPWGGLESGHGNYFLSLQGAGSYVEQEFTELSPGQSYEIRFLAAHRPGYGDDEQLKVLVNGLEVWETAHPSGSFVRYTTTFVAPGTTAKIRFENDSPEGDRSVFVDDVHVMPTGEESHCERCPPRSYSNHTNAVSCIKCLTLADCAPGEKLVGKCTATAGPVCSASGPTTVPPVTDPSTIAGTTRVVVAVDGRADSAEEFVDNGDMYTTSSDLEFCADIRNDWGPREQFVLVTFPNVDIPPRMKILSASVVFEVDETRDGVSDQPLTVDIYGESNPSAKPSGKKYDISTRCWTKASQSWSPAPSAKVGDELITADLTKVVQEIIAGSAWTSGSRLGLMFKRADRSGSGNRWLESATSQDRAEDVTPRLEIVASRSQHVSRVPVAPCTATPPRPPTPQPTIRVVPTTQAQTTTAPITESPGVCVSSGQGALGGFMTDERCGALGGFAELFCTVIPGCKFVVGSTAAPITIKVSTMTATTVTTVTATSHTTATTTTVCKSPCVPMTHTTDTLTTATTTTTMKATRPPRTTTPTVPMQVGFPSVVISIPVDSPNAIATWKIKTAFLDASAKGGFALNRQAIRTVVIEPSSDGAGVVATLVFDPNESDTASAAQSVVENSLAAVNKAIRRGALVISIKDGGTVSVSQPASIVYMTSVTMAIDSPVSLSNMPGTKQDALKDAVTNLVLTSLPFASVPVDLKSRSVVKLIQKPKQIVAVVLLRGDALQGKTPKEFADAMTAKLPTGKFPLKVDGFDPDPVVQSVQIDLPAAESAEAAIMTTTAATTAPIFETDVPVAPSSNPSKGGGGVTPAALFAIVAAILSLLVVVLRIWSKRQKRHTLAGTSGPSSTGSTYSKVSHNDGDNDDDDEMIQMDPVG